MARDPWLDNVKMVLVTVVVVGHSLTMVPGEGRNAQIYDFIYYWHIPAFVLVTGFLSRSFTWSRRHLWALFCTIVVPYFLFEFALLFYREHRGGEVIGAPMWLNPHWPRQFGRLEFEVRYRHQALTVAVSGREVRIAAHPGPGGPVRVGCGAELRDLRPGGVSGDQRDRGAADQQRRSQSIRISHAHTSFASSSERQARTPPPMFPTCRVARGFTPAGVNRALTCRVRLTAFRGTA